MKQLCFFIIGLFCCFSGYSQQTKDTNKSGANQSAKALLPPLKFDKSVINSKAKWKLVSKNKYAKVYESPIDKMHCIVSRLHSEMPVSDPSLNEAFVKKRYTMPNLMLNDLRIPDPLTTSNSAIEK